MKKSQTIIASPLLTIVAGAALLGSCGSPENGNFPKKPQDIPQRADSKADKRWQLLAKELRIDDNTKTTDRTDLRKRLATPSAWITDTSAEGTAKYTAKITELVGEYASEAYKTQCGAIDSVVEVGDATTADVTTWKAGAKLNAKVYLLKFRLKKDKDGNVEDAANQRAGLVVVPTSTDATQKAPIVAYGHGGDKGLSYLEMAAIFGDQQNSHIILAPAFPSEPVCLGKTSGTGSCDEGGTLAEKSKNEYRPFDAEVDELLGMHDCVVRAAFNLGQAGGDLTTNLYQPLAAKSALGIVDSKGAAVTSNGTQVDFSSLITARVKRIGATTTPTNAAEILVSQTPISYSAGISRGSLSAQLAVVRAGAQAQAAQGAVASAAAKGTQAAAEVQATLGTGYVQPARFSCALDVFGPTTFTSSEFRLAMETFTKGYGEYTNFIHLPAARYFSERLTEYGKGNPFDPDAAKKSYTDEELAKMAAKDIWKLDATIQAPLLLGALRNWRVGTTDKTGTLLMIHGHYDRTVPVSQTLLGSNLYFRVNAALKSAEKIPGVEVHAVGFSPLAKYLEKAADGSPKLKDTVDGKRVGQHGDEAFYTSVADKTFLQCEDPEKLTDASAKDLAMLCKAADTAQRTAYEMDAKAQTPATVIQNWLTNECVDRQGK